MRIRLILPLAALLAFTLPALANTWTGTITQTVTETNDPLYQAGETFTGSYHYESPTVDGSFYTYFFDPVEFGRPANANDSLTGSIYMTFPDTFNGFNSLDTMNEGKLVVSGGEVTSFFWSWEMGGYFIYVGGSGFGSLVYDKYDQTTGEELPNIITAGSVDFSAPDEAGLNSPHVRFPGPSTRVPDAFPTALLLLLACVGLLGLKYRGWRERCF